MEYHLLEDLNINFNEHDNYELSINRIDNSLNTTIDNLGTLQNLVANKVGIATYNDKMSELEKKDGELASLISEGDLNTLNSCMESINIISSRISTSETDILTNKTNIATITNTTIPSLTNLTSEFLVIFPSVIYEPAIVPIPEALYVALTSA
mgnify:CR=1 FL=1